MFWYWQLAVSLAVLALGMVFEAPPLLHVFQLESYKLSLLFRWVKKAWLRFLAISILGLAATVIGGGVASLVRHFFQGSVERGFPLWLFEWIVSLCIVIIPFCGRLVLFWVWKKRPRKKPLVYTARAKRLLATNGLVWLLLLGIVYAALVGFDAKNAGTIVFYAAALFPIPVFALSAVAVRPLEKAIQRWYFNDARKKLAARKDLLRIGVTGSYGKTSVKVMLGTILGEKYKTYITPSSYNTPMGVGRVIREELPDDAQVFVAEMGARQKGDIAEMCDLVHPQYGIITSIGPQHLETFHTMENIADTKFELAQAIPQDGRIFLPADNSYCLDRYRKAPQGKSLFGLAPVAEGLAMTAQDVAVSHSGSAFTLVNRKGETAVCTTRLLGKHNVQNLLGCAALARELGFSMDEIARGIQKVQPVEHRLQLLETGNGVAVIDDAFNSSPDGTRAALEVLSGFPGRKIVVTPGLVELGDREEEENRIFGQNMAAVVDIAILVARNGKAMREGLLEKGFPTGQIMEAKNLQEATAMLAKLTRIGDVVLFENDLPDHYE